MRGTISNRLSKKDADDPAKLDSKIDKPNLQMVDVASLPAEHDSLKLHFTLRVLSGAGEPCACNSPEFQQKLTSLVQDYTQKFHWLELAKRYAINLANARFLWRNRMSAQQVQTTISVLTQGIKTKLGVFDSLAFSLQNFSIPEKYTKKIQELTEAIAKTLSGEQQNLLLDIETIAQMGPGLEVFPSQELSLNTNGQGDKSKILYQVNNVAAMHSQKIGNALRCIDDWGEFASSLGPIAVETYGAVTSQGKAYRQPKDKTDFYSLFDKWTCKDIALTEPELHFVMAVLVRGGVFGEGKE